MQPVPAGVVTSTFTAPAACAGVVAVIVVAFTTMTLVAAADPNVIAVTATNSDDKLFTGANRGNYIAVAAPGVDILAPAPEGAHQFTTGTSVAAAEVSGVAALLIERNPSLTPGGSSGGSY